MSILLKIIFIKIKYFYKNPKLYYYIFKFIFKYAKIFNYKDLKLIFNLIKVLLKIIIKIPLLSILIFFYYIYNTMDNKTLLILFVFIYTSISVILWILITKYLLNILVILNSLKDFLLTSNKDIKPDINKKDKTFTKKVKPTIKNQSKNTDKKIINKK